MARSHYRGTVYGNLTTGAKPLPGAAIRLYHPDTGAPWALPVYPDRVNGTPYPMPIYTNPVGEWEIWAEEPARVRAEVTHPSFYSVGEEVEIRPDPETQATDTDLVESVADHEAKEDPHDQYLTEPEGNLLYKPVGYEPDLTDYYTRGEADDEFLDQDEADLRYEQLSRKGMPSGYAPLDFAGVIPPVYLPPLAITETWVVISEAEMLALPAQQGDVAVRLDTTENYILRVDPATVLANWTKLAASTTAGNTTVLRREEFTPSAAATTVTLAAPPTTVHAVSRNGVGQSQPAGHYSLSGLVLTFTDPFELGERVAVVYEIGSTVPAPVNGYTKEESDALYEPIDTMYTKGESDLRYQPLGSYSLTSHTHPYLPLSGGDLTGALSVLTKPVNVSPDSGNALVWRANGFYAPPGGATGDFLPLEGGTLTGSVLVTDPVSNPGFETAVHAGMISISSPPGGLWAELSPGSLGLNGDGVYGQLSVLPTGGLSLYGGPFVPSSPNTQDLGSSTKRWSKVWATDADFTNTPTVNGVPIGGGGGGLDQATADLRYLQLTGGVLTGTLGAGVTPQSWDTGRKVIQIGQTGSIVGYASANEMEIGANTYTDPSLQRRAIVDGRGVYLRAYDGKMQVYIDDLYRTAGTVQVAYVMRATISDYGLTLQPRSGSAAIVIGTTAQPKITVNVNQPSSPMTGDLWIW